MSATFEPPHCPNPECAYHRDPPANFYTRRGSYRPACRTEDVPRFRCRGCGRYFSRQTFRHDYRDRRPECNERLFELLISGVGLRQSGRVLHLDVHAVQKKARKIGRTCSELHRSLCRSLPAGGTYVLDEEETYEAASIRPLTMPVLIERESWFVVSTDVGPIRRIAAKGTRRRRLQESDERRNGKRPDCSAACVRTVLERLRELTPEGPIVLWTDLKPSYVRIARSVFGERVEHHRVSSRLVRTTFNPLFPINTTLAMTRDNCGRLRRQSWLVTKRAKYLQLHATVFAVYRNYVRRRFNRDKPHETPAVLLKLLPRQLSIAEILAWRQDLPRSIPPIPPGDDAPARRLQTA